ncbi:hypothetical protein Nepgr_033643 [Nepenthes gracilis]|uniref:Uncharacterized protein n=1 Tax=Nepenthes gracilis TaxID=150966 RepID=A0AAD3Y8T3_NEPGR|nr:hypothetical protein Nepgr_033643 [Nepenthes gracilis]
MMWWLMVLITSDGGIWIELLFQLVSVFFCGNNGHQSATGLLPADAITLLLYLVLLLLVATGPLHCLLEVDGLSLAAGAVNVEACRLTRLNHWFLGADGVLHAFSFLSTDLMLLPGALWAVVMPNVYAVSLKGSAAWLLFISCRQICKGVVWVGFLRCTRLQNFHGVENTSMLQQALAMPFDGLSSLL